MVSPGDRVDADQVVVIVEAMKMEVAVRSPQSGIVKAVCCAVGRPVAAGDILLVLE
jgi:urea carboxylase